MMEELADHKKVLVVDCKAQHFPLCSQGNDEAPNVFYQTLMNAV
jgi:hypothetical protein